MKTKLQYTVENMPIILGEKKWKTLQLYLNLHSIIINDSNLNEFGNNEIQSNEFESWFVNLSTYPHLSNSVSKLGSSIISINLPVGITCRPDAPCARTCYANKGNFTYTGVKNGIMNNYYAYLLDNKHFFDVVDCTLKLIPYKFLRWHSSGDIVDSNYLDGMCKIAKRHPKTKCLCFTKQYELVNEYLATHKKPQNLVIVLSSWGSFIPQNPFNLPTSWVKLNKEDTYIPQEARECNKYCGECALSENSCWKLKNGESVVFHQH